MSFGVEMDSEQLKAVANIKARVSLMLKERQGLNEVDSGSTVPSEVWTGACSMFDYLLTMADESFSKIRLHTHFLTSDLYLPYAVGTGKEIQRARWEKATASLPDKYKIYEAPGGFGFDFDGAGLVSRDVIRYQITIAALYHQNALKLIESDSHKYILEIGSGYGGLAHHLMNLAGPATYVMVDLPETFLFSAPYVALQNPGKSIYVYNESDFDEVLASGLSKFDFVFIPNYRLHDLEQLKFELVLNLNSMQEMTTAQVEEYLNFVSKTCTGKFYSCNLDRLEQNEELSSLSELLSKKFKLTEIFSEDKLKNSIKSVLNVAKKTMGSPGRYYYYREFLCEPRQ